MAFQGYTHALNYFKRFKQISFAGIKERGIIFVNKLESLACSMGVLCTQNKLKDYLLFGSKF